MCVPPWLFCEKASFPYRTVLACPDNARNHGLWSRRMGVMEKSRTELKAGRRTIRRYYATCTHSGYPLSILNGISSWAAQGKSCVDKHAKPPNFRAVPFWCPSCEGLTGRYSRVVGHCLKTLFQILDLVRRRSNFGRARKSDCFLLVCTKLVRENRSPLEGRARRREKPPQGMPEN